MKKKISTISRKLKIQILQMHIENIDPSSSHAAKTSHRRLTLSLTVRWKHFPFIPASHWGSSRRQSGHSLSAPSFAELWHSTSLAFHQRKTRPKQPQVKSASSFVYVGHLYSMNPIVSATCIFCCSSCENIAWCVHSNLMFMISNSFNFS